MADGGDGGWEVPWYVVCKLEVLGSWYYNLVQDKRLKNSEDRCCKSPPVSESQRTTRVKVREPEKWMSQSERVNSLFCLFVLLRLSRMGCYPFTVGWTFFFTQSPNTNANLLQKHPHSTPEIMFYQLSGHPFCPVKVTHKINHHVESDRVGLASYLLWDLGKVLSLSVPWYLTPWDRR